MQLLVRPWLSAMLQKAASSALGVLEILRRRRELQEPFFGVIVFVTCVACGSCDGQHRNVIVLACAVSNRTRETVSAFVKLIKTLRHHGPSMTSAVAFSASVLLWA